MIRLQDTRMDYAENYSALTDDELLKVAAGRSHLVHDAALALDSEMSHRRLDYKEAFSRRRETTRQQIHEARVQSAPKGNKYLVGRMNGWTTLLVIIVPLAVFLPSMIFHLVPEEWQFPIFNTCLSTGLALGMTRPWLKRTVSFWLSLFASCTVQLPIGYWINVRTAPYTRGELKGAGFLTIAAGYALGAALFLLLQKMMPTVAAQETGQPPSN